MLQLGIELLNNDLPSWQERGVLLDVTCSLSLPVTIPEYLLEKMVTVGLGTSLNAHVNITSK